MTKMWMPLVEARVIAKIQDFLLSDVDSRNHQAFLKRLLECLPEGQDYRAEFTAGTLAKGGKVLADHPYWHGSDDAATRAVASILKVIEAEAVEVSDD